MIKKINSRPPLQSLLYLLILFGLSSCIDSNLENEEPNEQLERIKNWASNLPNDAFILASYSKAYTLTDENKSEVFDIISQELYDIKLHKPDSIFNDFRSVDIKKIKRSTYRDTFLLDLKTSYDSYKLKDANVYKLGWTYKDQDYTSYAIIDSNQQILDPIYGFLNRSTHNSFDSSSRLFYGTCESYKSDNPSIYQTGKVLSMDSYGPDRGYIQLISNLYYNTYITNKDTPEEKLDIEVKNIETKICSDFQGNFFGKAEFQNEMSYTPEILNKKLWEFFVLDYSASLSIAKTSEIIDSLDFDKQNTYRTTTFNSKISFNRELIRRHALKLEN